MFFPKRSHHVVRSRRPRTLKLGVENLEGRVVLSGLSLASAAARSVLFQPTYVVYHPEGTSATTGQITPDGESSTPLATSYSPAQIRAAYGINNITFGSIQGNGAGQTIAIVDAYDDPRFVNSSASNFSTSDLAEFDKQFGLPNPPSFTKVNQEGQTSPLPSVDPVGAGGDNWEIEEALDVEWTHAMAPAANIILVEANDPSNNLFIAAQTAARLPGVSVVSMSWGGSEQSADPSFNSQFAVPGVTFLASTGDDGAPGGYPAYSPDVVAVGGTSLQNLNAGGTYPGTGLNGEVAWSDSGGGISQEESEPSYQDSVQITGKRAIPDVSFDANPNTGVSVYDSYNNVPGSILGNNGPWEQIGGTSLAAPAWAGLIAIANQGRVLAGGSPLSGSTQTLPALYSLPSTDFHDILTGSNGGFSAHSGYDEVTGLGSPVANLLVPALSNFDLTDKLVVTSQPPSSVNAGSPFGLTVQVETASNNVVTGFNGSVTIALSSNPGKSTLSGTLTVTAKSGVASFSGLSLNEVGTGYTLKLTSGTLTAATTSAVNVTPAAASKLVVTTQPPSSVTAGSGFGLTVQVEDSFGNVATSFNSSVTVALSSNPGKSTLGGTLTVTAKSGVAIFSGLTLNEASTGYTLKLSSGTLTAATTTAFNVTPDVATKLVVISQPPSSVTAGSGFGLTVQVEDASGKGFTSFKGSVTIALSSNPGKSTLGGTLTVTAKSGVATFSGLTLKEAGTGYTLELTSGTLTAATTTAFNVIPAAASKLVVTTQPPSSVTAGSGFGLTVQVEDSFGNVATSFNSSVKIALVSNPGKSTLGGTLSVTAKNGVATFSGLILDEAATGYTLKLTSGTLTAATTTAFNVIPAAASKLVVTTQPLATVTTGSGFGLIVEVEDAFGNVVTGFNGSVTIALGSNPGKSTLGGTLSVTVKNGVATFSGLTLNKAGIGYTLKVTAGTLTAATTNAFNVVA